MRNLCHAGKAETVEHGGCALLPVHMRRDEAQVGTNREHRQSQARTCPRCLIVDHNSLGPKGLCSRRKADSRPAFLPIEARLLLMQVYTALAPTIAILAVVLRVKNLRISEISKRQT